MPVSRREFLSRAGAAAGLSLSAAAADKTARAPQNIVFILIDDLRYDAMGFMGHPFLETPHLDALARDGMVFDRAFVTTALCSPSRATILTGMYAHRHGVFDNNTLLRDEFQTFPQLLQTAGYRTAFVGKWHMGGESDDPRPGFDHWVSFRGQGRYLDPTLNVNGERHQVKGYTTDLLTDEAVRFMNETHDRPFFLYLSHKAVHADFRPADRHAGRYADKTYPRPASMANTEDNYRGKPAWVREQRRSWHGVDGMYDKKVDYDDFTRAYAETMLAVDDSVGRIVETLRERKLLDSTLLVFTSDNGFLFGEHGLIDKRCMYEESIRVPLIVHCPELMPAGRRRLELVTNLDFAPTFLEFAGVAVPEDMQGASLMPLIRGEQPHWREAILYEYFWEDSFPQTPTVYGIRTDGYKLMEFHGIWDRFELYDLEIDPGEMNNLVADYVIETDSGATEQAILRKAPEELRTLFRNLHDRLLELLRQSGALRSPKWAGP
jgi:N-acetylglucosamine-6-sulfatase